MAWNIEFDPAALKELSRLSEEAQKRIIQYLKKRVAKSHDPKKLGKPLRGEKTGLWRYRLGKYRIICLIEKKLLRVLVLRIGHRRNVYG